MKDLFDLTGRKALVTGGATGIGEGIALGLAAAGADVALTYRSHAPADATAKIEAYGRKAAAVQADFAARDEAAAGDIIGFAAETQDVAGNARAKLARKGADFIIANDVSHDSGIGGAGGVMGGDRNRVTLVSKDDADRWPEMDKAEVAARIADLVARHLQTLTT